MENRKPKLPIFDPYQPIPGAYDELFAPDGTPREAAKAVTDRIARIGAGELQKRQRLASHALLRSGITFNVYSDRRGGERVLPFDVIPRVIPAEDWQPLKRGLVQRVRVLNAFLNDIYGAQRILEAGVIPRSMVEGCSGYLEQMRGVRPTQGVYVHIAGIDLIRDDAGRFLVLEDNARTPSGVSYVLENRVVLKRVLGPVFTKLGVKSVDAYPRRLREALGALSPRPSDAPRMVVMTPGPFNSAYFEHSFLARRMGCDLVQPSDLFVDDDVVFLKTTAGPERVDVIYRRVDDDFLDPLVFRKDSLLGVPGIVEAYRKGRVTLANAIGNGVVDDKAIYPFVPDMTRFYLSEEPELGQVKTYLCYRRDELAYVLEHLEELVVKRVDASGGYGMLIGPTASKKKIAEFAAAVRRHPEQYIAQPLIELSTCPTWADGGAHPRRIDLRPFVVTGQDSWVLPGGLTRVALAEGSYVVNSSQGGGSKDTWVLGGGAE